MIPYIIGGILLTGFIISQSQKNKKRSRVEMERRAAAEALRKKTLVDFFGQKMAVIEIAVAKHEDDISFHTFYNNKKKEDWIKSYSSLYKEIKGKDFTTINLPSSQLKLIERFLQLNTTINSEVESYNSAFITVELQIHAKLFDNVEKRKLDMQQRTAVVQDEDNNLIIAGAGSGKTTTIIGELVNYYLTKQ